MRNNDNAANRYSYIGEIYSLGEQLKKKQILESMPEKWRKLHEEGYIHIHDLDFLTLTTTCTQIDLTELFSGGFSTGHGVLREPQDIGSYSALACIAIQSNQNDQHGGQAIASFDYDMVPGVAKTYVKEYRRALGAGLELLLSMPQGDDRAREILRQIEQ